MQLELLAKERDFAIEEGMMALLVLLKEGTEMKGIGYFVLHTDEVAYRFDVAEVAEPFLVVEKYTNDDARVA